QPADDVSVQAPLTNVGVITDFLTQLFGALQPPIQDGFVAGDPSEYMGYYIAQSVPHSDMEAMMKFTNPMSTVRVELDDEEQVLINGKGPYREIAPGVFWSDAVQMSLDSYFLTSPLFTFTRDESGAIDYLTPQIGFDAWVKGSVWSTPSVYATLWIVLFLILLSGLLCIFYPRVPGKPMLKWLPPLIVLTLIAMPCVLLLGYGENESLVNELFFGHTSRFVGFAVLANVVVLLAIFTAWYAFKSWKEHYWDAKRYGWLVRLHYSALGIVALGYIPIFHYANLLVV
ncbi:MAG: hypothetical protein AAGC93_27840, partial [Cyanobacteria bacterium P01_F01_bin.53]